MPQKTQVAKEIRNHQDLILNDWINYQLSAVTLRRDLLKEQELREASRHFLDLFVNALEDNADVSAPAWKPTKEFLGELSHARALQGFSPSETATFVFSLKQPVFDLFQRQNQQDAKSLADELWSMTLLLDKLGLHTMEVYQQSRESIIQRQQQEMLELSTPVVQLWDEVLALPLIGTLDSGRT